MNNPVKRKRGRPFGSKVAPGKKDGRPAFIPTEDQKFLVTMMSSTVVPHERQAKALGVNSKTLRKSISRKNFKSVGIGLMLKLQERCISEHQMETFQRRFFILKRKPGGEKRNGLNLPEQKAKILLLIQSDIKDWRLFCNLNLSCLTTQPRDIAVH